jgi:hypothetical protein
VARAGYAGGGTSVSRTTWDQDGTQRAKVGSVRADLNFVHSMQELIDAMIVGG